MRAFEEQWAISALEGFAPPRKHGFSPAEGQVDYGATLRRMVNSASSRARLGIRVGVWIIALSPLWLGIGSRSLASLPLRERSRVLGRLLRHRFFIVRELTLIFKVLASMAIFQVAELRALSGYDAPSGAQSFAQSASGQGSPHTHRGDADRTGPRRRLRLVPTDFDEANVA